MNIQRSFSHTDLALELKDELEESLEEQQAFDGIKIQQERIGERGLQETVIFVPSLIIKKDKWWRTKRNLPQDGTKVIRINRTGG